MRNFLTLAGAGLLLCCAIPSRAQVALPFTLTVQNGQNVTPVVSGQTLAVTSNGIGQATTFTLSGTYTGTTSAVFASDPALLGSPDFSVAHLTPAVPATIAPGQTFSVKVTYTPTSTAISTATLSLPFTITPAAAGGTPTPGTIAFVLSAAAANLTVNYYQPPGNNITPLANGSTIPFPQTLVGTSFTTTVIIANTGAAAGTVSAVTLAPNSPFALQAVGLLPAGVNAGGTFSFNIIYTPTASQNDTGTLTIQFPSGPFVINLTGTGTSANLTYQMTVGSTTTNFTPGQTLTLPDTNVGSTTPVTITVQNSGTATSQISNIGVTGAAYGLGSLPSLPVFLGANTSTSFTLDFTPVTPSVAAGSMTIGGARFNLTGKGLGQLLTYSYVAGSGVSTPVLPGGTVLFSSTPLAQSTSATVTVTNSGTLPVSITSVGLGSGTIASFNITNLPSLPATLQPGGTISFTIVFLPVAAGLNSATLLVNGSAINLSGFGTGAPALPSFSITGPSGTVQPFTQLAVGLNLSQGYPLDVTGVLTITLSSNVFTADPAVQFATGGRTVAFTIPANTKNAVFSNGANTVQFQTGTVAENITFSATFATGNNVNITPGNGSTLTLTVPQLAPTLLSVQINAVTTTTVTLLIEGYSTTRSLSKLAITFKSLSPSFSLPSTPFSLDASQGSAFWYASTTSAAYGGEFAITYPFEITNNTGNANLPFANNILATVVASNSIGTSNSVSTQ
jgi:hypothetical protein